MQSVWQDLALSLARHFPVYSSDATACVERDTGFVTDEKTMLNHLKLMLSGDYMGDSDFDSDDDDDDDD